MSELTAALHLWRTTRHPELDHIVRALGQTERTERRWPDRPEDPPSFADTEVTPLLETLTDTDSERATARLHRLWSRGPDPRVVEAAREWALALTFRARGSRETWWDMLARVLSEGLPQDIDFPALGRQILLRHQTNFGIQAARRIGRLVSVAPAPRDLTEAEARRVEQWLQAHPWPVQPPPRNGPTLDELLDAIAAAPDEEGPRAVLADLLIEQRDPRGAFIAEELAAARNSLAQAPSASARAALRTHAAAWFGPWFVAVMRYQTERGFPVSATASTRLRNLHEVVGSPGLRTLRRLSSTNTTLPRGGSSPRFWRTQGYEISHGCRPCTHTTSPSYPRWRFSLSGWASGLAIPSLRRGPT